MGLSVFDENLPLCAQLVRTITQTTVAQSLLPVANQPRRIDNIIIASTDTIDHIVDLYVVQSAVTTLLGSFNVPAGSGYLGVPAVDAIAKLVPTLAGGLVLPGLATLTVDTPVQVTISDLVAFTVLGGWL